MESNTKVSVNEVKSQVKVTVQVEDELEAREMEMEKDVSIIHPLCIQQRVHLNPQKTQNLIIGNPFPNHLVIFLNNSVIKTWESMKNVGGT